MGRLKRHLRLHFAAKRAVLETLAYLVIDADAFTRLDAVVRQELDAAKEFLALTGTPGFVPSALFHAFPADSAERRDLERWFAPELQRLLPSRLVDDGASRTRPLGRFYLYLRRGPVLERLRAVLRRVQDAATKEQAGVRSPGFRVLIVSGTCGGTGAGIFLDVLYYLHLLLHQMGQAPTVETLLFLPELFIDKAQKAAPGLEPFLRANAYAFFRELDYVLKYPERFNDLVMDTLSAGRAAAGRGGAGLPPSLNEPVWLNYLVGQGIPGPGNFSDPTDLYDYAARALYQVLLTQPADAGETASDRVRAHYSNVRTFAADPDAFKQRPKRYAAIGYAEVRFPRELIADYLVARYRHAAVNLGLRGPSDWWTAQDMEAAATLLFQQTADISRELQAVLAPIADGVVNRVSPLDHYRVDGKLPLAAIGPDWINDRRTEAEGLVAEGRRALGIAYRGTQGALVARFRQLIEGQVDTLLDGRGTRFTRAVLERLDRRLEQLLQDRLHGPSDSERHSDEAARAALGRALGDREQGSDIVSRLPKGMWRSQNAMTKVLEPFCDALRDYVRSSLDAQRWHLHGELLKHFAGEHHDTDPYVEDYDETGQLRQGQRRPSVLDRVEARLTQIEAEVCAEWLPTIAPARILQDWWHGQGRSLTSRFLPAYPTYESLDADAEVGGLFAHLFPGLTERARLDARTAEVRGILTDLGAEGLPLSRVFQEADVTRAREALDRVFTRRAQRRLDDLDQDRTWTGLRLSQSVWDRPELADPARATQLLASLASLATPSCDARITELQQNDQGSITRLMTLGLHDASKAKAVPGHETMALVEKPPDQVTLTSVVACFPVWIVNEFRIQEPHYYGRRGQAINFPHLDRQFEQGDLDLRDPFGVEVSPPIQTFAMARAVTEHLLEGALAASAVPAARETFLGRWKWVGPTYGSSPVPFKLVYPERDAWYAVRATVTRADGNYEVAPTDRAPICFFTRSRTTGRTATSADIYKAYAARFDVVQSHSGFLATIRQDEMGRELLLGACEAYRKRVLENYERERTKPGVFKEELDALGNLLEALDRILVELRPEDQEDRV